MAERRTFGVYNAMGPAAHLSMAEMLYGMKAITTAGAQFTWVPADFLRAQKISAWRDMPVWVPASGPTLGFMARNNARAVAAGLTFRPLADTAQATLDYNNARPDAQRKALEAGAIAGISAAREAEVLAAWHAARTGRGSE